LQAPQHILPDKQDLLSLPCSYSPNDKAAWHFLPSQYARLLILLEKPSLALLPDRLVPDRKSSLAYPSFTYQICQAAQSFWKA